MVESQDVELRSVYTSPRLVRQPREIDIGIDLSRLLGIFGTHRFSLLPPRHGTSKVISTSTGNCSNGSGRSLACAPCNLTSPTVRSYRLAGTGRIHCHRQQCIISLLRLRQDAGAELGVEGKGGNTTCFGIARWLAWGFGRTTLLSAQDEEDFVFGAVLGDCSWVASCVVVDMEWRDRAALKALETWMKVYGS